MGAPIEYILICSLAYRQTPHERLIGGFGSVFWLPLRNWKCNANAEKEIPGLNLNGTLLSKPTSARAQ
jgi:hypothetical protein